ncbi:MAG: hypothetical protein ACK5M1_14935 [Xanthomarina gelatinilytica]|uniref:hypothetical protein n=1 Tax=Xanthomarina gelatinilytica TaxID=1137281 RepID=UPI003A88B0A4
MNSPKSQYDWQVYNAEETGLGTRGENFNKLLIEDGAFYLLGNSSGNDLSKSKSIVYKSEDNGNSWTEEYTGAGNISDGYFALQELNLFKEVYSDSSLDNTSLSLINRDSVIHSFKKNSSVKGVFMDSYGKGAVVVNNSFSANDNAVFWTIDNFKNYDSTYVGKSIKKSYFFNSKVYLLTYELTRENYKVQEKNGIDIIDKNGNQQSLQIKSNVEDFIVDGEGIFLLKKQNGISIEYLSKEGQEEMISLIKKNALTPKKIYKHNKFIAVLTSTVDKSALGGFGGSEYQLFLSFDKGQTFKQEKLPINDFVGAIGFYKDEKIIIYSGAGRISVCHL